MLRELLDIFWAREFWLPANVTWEDVRPRPDKDVAYTDYRDLLISIPLAPVLILLRHLLETYCFTPLFKRVGIKNSRRMKAPANPKLEAAYRVSPKIKQTELCGLAKQLDISERQVERWWRLRRSQDKPSTLFKFCVDCWQCTYYSLSFLYGLFILWDKEWFWNIGYCFIGLPHQGTTTDVTWYFIVSSAFYWSMIITQFWDVRQFWLMFVHHIVAVIMITFAWVCNGHRLACLILFLHDGSAIFLETAKAAKRTKYVTFGVYFFAVFAVTWAFSRTCGILFLYWSGIFLAPKLMEMFPACYLFMVLGLVLTGLHIIWSWFILQWVHKTIKTGQIQADDISDSSSHESDQTIPNIVNKET